MWLAALLLAAPKEKPTKVPIFGAHKPRSSERGVPHTAAEQAELAIFLKGIGYPQYATPEFIQKMDEQLAYDSIEDLAYMEEDDDMVTELGISTEDVEVIQEAAHKELLRRFLVDLPGGSLVRHLDQLYEEGFEEIEDLEDLDENDVGGVEGGVPGLSLEEIELLSEQAELHGARQLLTILLATIVPFRDPAVHKPRVEALLAAGVRTFRDLGNLTAGEVAGLSDADLALVQSDKRVLAQMNKSEL